MFGSFGGPRQAPLAGEAFPIDPFHPTYGPAIGDSQVEWKVGPRGYDGGINNSPFAEGRIKEPFLAPGPFNPFAFAKPRRRRINLLSLVQVMALPCAVFALTVYMFGFSVRSTAPLWSWFFGAFCIIIAAVFLLKAVVVLRKQKEEMWTVPWYLRDDDDTWFLFLAAAVFIACLSGFVVGEIIYSDNTQPYYTLADLHSYSKVDPIAEGKAYLDAGAIEFKNHSFVDVHHGLGYKDGHVYCVAPVKLGSDKVANYDFWAVGVDCCTGFPGSFSCFADETDRAATGALRVIDDDTIPFYKLAVMQANEEWGKNSPNPLFFTWMKAPVAKINSYWSNAMRIYLRSLAVFVALEVAVVLVAVNTYWKNRLWG